MHFKDLNAKYDVRVVCTLGQYEKVHVGYFTSYADAEAYLAEAKTADGCELPTDQTPLIWPPHSKPEDRGGILGDLLSESLGRICVAVIVSDDRESRPNATLL